MQVDRQSCHLCRYSKLGRFSKKGKIGPGLILPMGNSKPGPFSVEGCVCVCSIHVYTTTPENGDAPTHVLCNLISSMVYNFL